MTISRVRTWNMVRNTEKREKKRMVTSRTRKWEENFKTWTMRHKHCLTWHMVRNTQKLNK